MADPCMVNSSKLPVQAIVYDISGREVVRKEILTLDSEAAFELDCTILAPGSYFLQVKLSETGERFTTQILKTP